VKIWFQGFPFKWVNLYRYLKLRNHSVVHFLGLVVAVTATPGRVVHQSISVDPELDSAPGFNP
jgi:hypothetical protein